MRKPALALAILTAIALGCRSSEEARTADEMAAPTTGSALDADRIEPSERVDEAERWERKTIGQAARDEARRDAARERNRRIDAQPVEPPPAPPPVEETPRR